MSDDRPLSQPFPDFQILLKIGTGSMGAVFLARQRNLDRLVALKVLKPSLSKDRRYVERLEREARLVARLDHPNVVTAYDLRAEKGYHYFVMEYVEGRSLRDLLKDWGRLPEEQVLQIGIKMADALEHARRHGVIHRDVKPANILVQSDDNVKLADLGLAKGPETVSTTKDGSGTLGTPLYMSPEQARNPTETDIRSDIYSLGATLFHAACGVPPFTGSTLGEVLTKVLHGDSVVPREYFPELSEGLDLVLRKCLLRDPDRRYQKPSEMREDLERVRLANLPAVDPRDLEDRRPGRSRLVSTLAALALAGAAGLAWYLSRPPIPPAPGPGAPASESNLVAELEGARTAELVGLIGRLQGLADGGDREAAKVLSRARVRLCDRVFRSTDAKEKGLRKRLERPRGDLLVRFPSLVDEVQQRGLTAEFGVTPRDLPDPRAVNIYLLSRKRLLEQWEVAVADRVQRGLERLAEAEAGVQAQWSQRELNRDFVRRLSALQAAFADLSLTDHPLPPPETAQLEQARQEVVERLRASLRREADSWVTSQRNRLDKALSRVEERLRLSRNTGDTLLLRQLRGTLGDLRSYLNQATLRDDALPRHWNLGWSRRSWLARIGRLERQIDRSLVRGERLALDSLAGAFRDRLLERDYPACRDLLADVKLVTEEAAGRLAGLRWELDQVVSAEKLLIDNFGRLYGREMDLSIKGVVQRRRLVRARVTPGRGTLWVEDVDRRGRTRRVPYAEVDLKLLIDLLPPASAQANALPLTWLLTLGGLDELRYARSTHLDRVAAEYRPPLERRLAEREKVLRQPGQERERDATARLEKLKGWMATGLFPLSALATANHLLQRMGRTRLVQENQALITRLRDRAKALVAARKEQRQAKELFPGWELTFQLPKVRARVDLSRNPVGRLANLRRWTYREEGPSCLEEARSPADFLAATWDLNLPLQAKGPVKVELTLRLPAGRPRPDQLLLSLQGVHFALVRMSRGRLLAPRWRALVSAERLGEKSWMDRAWAAWFAAGEGVVLERGGTYRFAMELSEVTDRERYVRVFLDGAPLGSPRRIPYGGGGGTPLTFRASGALTITRLAVEGIP